MFLPVGIIRGRGTYISLSMEKRLPLSVVKAWKKASSKKIQPYWQDFSAGKHENLSDLLFTAGTKLYIME
jgi:hypothetical protein